VLRRPEEALYGRLLDDLPGVHHEGAVGHLRDDAEIVRDEEHREAELVAQAEQELEDLRLDRHVERRRRLVGDEETGPSREREGDHRALAHSPGHPVRQVAHPRPGVGKRDPREPRERLLAGVGPREAAVTAEHGDQLAPDRPDGIEHGTGLLEDEADPAAAQAAQLPLGERADAAPLEDDLAPTRRPDPGPGRAGRGR
jgi:hypothetical protein